MKTIITTFLLLITMVAVTSAEAQELWLDAEAKFGITKKLKADIEVEHRSREHFAATSRWSGSAGVSYKIKSWLSASASYKFIRNHEDGKITKKGNIVDSYWQNANRVQAGLTGSVKLGKFELSLRELYQYTHFNSTSSKKYDGFGNLKDDEYIEGENRNVLRSRLQAEYKHKKKCLVTPYASVELYSDLSDGFASRKVRYTGGADFRINKHNSVSAYYRFIDRTHSSNTNVIGVSYQFKL